MVAYADFATLLRNYADRYHEHLVVPRGQCWGEGDLGYSRDMAWIHTDQDTQMRIHVSLPRNKSHPITRHLVSSRAIARQSFAPLSAKVQLAILLLRSNLQEHGAFSTDEQTKNNNNKQIDARPYCFQIRHSRFGARSASKLCGQAKSTFRDLARALLRSYADGRGHRFAIWRALCLEAIRTGAGIDSRCAVLWGRLRYASREAPSALIVFITC